MAYHSHNRGDAKTRLTYEQEAEAKRRKAEAIAALGGDAPQLTADAAPLFPAIPEQDEENARPTGKRGRKGKVLYSEDDFAISRADISEITEDPNNVRVHTSRNIGMIVRAVQEVGAARSVVIDEDYTLMAGKGAREACIEAGIRKVLIVDADGETLVAVRRSNLSEVQKTRLALFDNRASDLSEFDPAGIMALEFDADGNETGLLDGMFTAEEVNALSVAAALLDDDEEEDTPLRFPAEGVRAGGGSTGKRFAFRLEFDTAEQYRKFEHFRRRLREMYGTDDTEAARFIAFIIEHDNDEEE